MELLDGRGTNSRDQKTRGIVVEEIEPPEGLQESP